MRRKPDFQNLSPIPDITEAISPSRSKDRAKTLSNSTRRIRYLLPLSRWAEKPSPQQQRTRRNGGGRGRPCSACVAGKNSSRSGAIRFTSMRSIGRGTGIDVGHENGNPFARKLSGMALERGRRLKLAVAHSFQVVRWRKPNSSSDKRHGEGSRAASFFRPSSLRGF